MTFSGPEYVATAWAMCFLTLIFVSMRLFLRHTRRSGGLNISDWLVVAGWLNFVFQTSVDTKTLVLGLYKGKIDTAATEFGPEHGLATYEDTVLALKLIYVEISFYYTEMYCIKLAMLCLYQELFPKTMKRLCQALRVTLILTILGWLSSVCFKLFGCHPLHTNWIPGPDYCNTKDATNSNAYEWGWHVFTDILIYILPLFLLKNLTLPRKQKIGVGLTFAVGFICIVFANLFQISLLINSPITVSWLLSAMEQTWSLIVVCCPTFRALVTKDIRKIFRRTVSTTTTTGSGRSHAVSHGASGFHARRPERDDKDHRESRESRESGGDEEMAVMERSRGSVIYERKEVTYRVESVDTLEQHTNHGLTTTVLGGEEASGGSKGQVRAQPFQFV